MLKSEMSEPRRNSNSHKRRAWERALETATRRRILRDSVRDLASAVFWAGAAYGLAIILVDRTRVNEEDIHSRAVLVGAGTLVTVLFLAGLRRLRRNLKAEFRVQMDDLRADIADLLGIRSQGYYDIVSSHTVYEFGSEANPVCLMRKSVVMHVAVGKIAQFRESLLCHDGHPEIEEPEFVLEVCPEGTTEDDVLRANLMWKTVYVQSMERSETPNGSPEWIAKLPGILRAGRFYRKTTTLVVAGAFQRERDEWVSQRVVGGKLVSLELRFAHESDGRTVHHWKTWPSAAPTATLRPPCEPDVRVRMQFLARHPTQSVYQVQLESPAPETSIDVAWKWPGSGTHNLDDGA